MKHFVLSLSRERRSTFMFERGERTRQVHKVSAQTIGRYLPRALLGNHQRFSSAFTVCPQEPIIACSDWNACCTPALVWCMFFFFFCTSFPHIPSIFAHRVQRANKILQYIKGKRNVSLIYLCGSRSLYLSSKANGIQKVWNLTKQ